jgi:hypothetical protein
MNSNSRTRRFLAASVVAILTSTQAAAQTSAAPSPSFPQPSSEASAHFDRGVSFYDEGDYSAALVEFTRAYSIAPAWQVLFNIGQSHFQVHDYAQALVTLNRYVDEGRERIPADRRSVVDAERADLANRVGYASIACNLAGATILVDDVAVGVAPLRDPVLVSVGVRKIAATHADRESVAQMASVPAGETVDVRLDFPEQAPSPLVAPTPREASPLRAEWTPPAPRSHAAAIVALGVAAAGATVGSVFGAFALRDKSRLEGECAGKACPTGSQNDIDAVSRDGWVSTIGFGVAAAGLVAGVVLWLTTGGPAAPPHDGALDVGPSFRTSGASLRLVPGAFTGSF